MTDHAGFINLQKDSCRIAGICQCPVKIPVLRKFKIINGIFQGTSGNSIFKFHTEKLLHIVVMYRARDQLQKIIIFHITLKLHYILIPPGKKPIFRSAPFQKSADRFWKRKSILQFMEIYVDHLMDAVVDPMVHFGLDQALEGVDDLSFFI